MMWLHSGKTTASYGLPARFSASISRSASRNGTDAHNVSPASAAEAITVGASTRADRYAWWSVAGCVNATFHA
jgi:hypothetical protein